jgi:hypothetical protein
VSERERARVSERERARVSESKSKSEIRERGREGERERGREKFKREECVSLTGNRTHRTGGPYREGEREI